MVLGVAKQAVSTEEAKRIRAKRASRERQELSEYDVYHKSPKGLGARGRIPPTGSHLRTSGSATKILSKNKAGRMRAKHFGSLNPSTT